MWDISPCFQKMNPFFEKICKMENNEVEILLVEDNSDDAELTIRALKKTM